MVPVLLLVWMVWYHTLFIATAAGRPGSFTIPPPHSSSLHSIIKMTESFSPPLEPIDWEPLYLSTIAGLSTCIGAAVVFCQPRSKENNTKIVPPHTMAFSLALAGSVMVTVSVISILPEVLMDDEGQEDENTSLSSSYQMIPIFSVQMLYRILFFGLGSGLYFGLSSLLNIPEPEEILDTVLLGQNTPTTHDEKFSLAVSSPHSNENDYECEMVELISSKPTSPLFDDEHMLENPLRTRKHQGLAQIPKSSPGDNNGKIKCSTSTPDADVFAKGKRVSSPSKGMSLSLRSWATGEDLESKEKKKAWRVAVLLFISLLVHNFPEGLAVAASALESTKLGMIRSVFLYHFDVCFIIYVYYYYWYQYQYQYQPVHSS